MYLFFAFMQGNMINKMPKGIMRSAVPLPCFFDVVKSQGVAGQRPRQGTKSCRMGRISIHPYVHPSIYLSAVPGPVVGSEGLPEEIEGQQEGSGGPSRGVLGPAKLA